MSITFDEVTSRSVQARERIRNGIYQTPLISARKIGKAINVNVLFKAENFQLTGSFKIRGATSKISAHSKGTSLITASSGNHGIASACAARELNRKLTVVLPENVSPMKLEKIRSYGVEIVIHGAETGLAEQHAQKLASANSFEYISPYNDLDVIAGQGTIGLEILEQCQHVDNVFISMGGGGLISGIGSVMKALSPHTTIYGISAINSKALAESIKAERVVETEHLQTLAAAVAGGIDSDTITLPLASRAIDQVIECSEEEIFAAMRSLAFDEGMIVEGSAALALAGFNKVAHVLEGETSVLILCGANVDESQIVYLLEQKQYSDIQ